MWSPLAILLSAAASSTVVQGASLVDVLKQNGASDLANRIASNLTIAAIYNSSRVKTVFAPIDSSLVQRKMKRLDISKDIDDASQASENGYVIASESVPNRRRAVSDGFGIIINTLSTDANLGDGVTQNVILDPSNLTLSNVAKRQNTLTFTTILPVPSAETITITYKASTPDCTTTTVLPPPTTVTVYANQLSPSPLSGLKIYAGLGKHVNVVKADVPYDGGVVQFVDNYFTPFESITDTASADNHTTFSQLSASANLSSTINNTPRITCFIPTNAAFAMSNATSSYASTASLLASHVIPNFLGYSPSLTNGMTLTTQGGTNLTVTRTGSDIFINNAKIIDLNLITINGVCHVVDSIITPSTTLPVPFTGDAMPPAKRSVTELALWGFALALGVKLFM